MKQPIKDTRKENDDISKVYDSVREGKKHWQKKQGKAKDRREGKEETQEPDKDKKGIKVKASSSWRDAHENEEDVTENTISDPTGRYECQLRGGRWIEGQPGTGVGFCMGHSTGPVESVDPSEDAHRKCEGSGGWWDEKAGKCRYDTESTGGPGGGRWPGPGNSDDQLPRSE